MWHAILILLILSPTEPTVPTSAPPEAWQALKEIALAAEIVGPHENWAADFCSELRYVRRHYAYLRHAPPLADASWLPPASITRELVIFNDQHQEYLRIQAVIYPSRADQLDDMLYEAKRLNCLWEAVRKASSPTDSWVSRRRMLGRIREEIGDDAYRRGLLPPPFLYRISRPSSVTEASTMPLAHDRSLNRAWVVWVRQPGNGPPRIWEPVKSFDDDVDAHRWLANYLITSNRAKCGISGLVLEQGQRPYGTEERPPAEA